MAAVEGHDRGECHGANQQPKAGDCLVECGTAAADRHGAIDHRIELHLPTETFERNGRRAAPRLDGNCSEFEWSEAIREGCSSGRRAHRPDVDAPNQDTRQDPIGQRLAESDQASDHDQQPEQEADDEAASRPPRPGKRNRPEVRKECPGYGHVRSTTPLAEDHASGRAGQPTVQTVCRAIPKFVRWRAVPWSRRPPIRRPPDEFAL